MGMMNKTHPGAGYLHGLLEWIGGSDGEKLLAAVTILLRLGPSVVEFLLLEALKPATQVAHKLRLLDLAERVGGTLSPADRARLQVLRHDSSAAVRQKASEVLAVLPARRGARRTGLRIGARGTGAVAGKLVAAWQTRQGTAGGRGGRSRSVPADGKSVAPASQPPTF
jgi:hypothetical protein